MGLMGTAVGRVSGALSGSGGALITGGFHMFDAYSNYQQQMEENPNQSKLWAGVKGVAKWAAYELPVTKPFMYAQHVADLGIMAGQTAVSMYNQGLASRKGHYQGNFGGSFQDNEARATMRQRGMAAIQESRLNARTILGSEARSLHRR